MNRIHEGVLCLVLLSAASSFAASFSVAPTIGTLGIGASAGVRIAPVAGVRVLGHTGSYSRDLHEEDIAYNGKLKFNNVGGIVDLYPGDGGFHVSAGVFLNSDRIDLASKPGQTITVNGVPYPSDAVGSVTGDVRFSKTSPYAGIGWGKSGRGFGVVFDLGAVYQGSPKLRVQAHPANPALVPPSFYTNLEAERAKTENDLRNYKYYPVVSLGVSFGF